MRIAIVTPEAFGFGGGINTFYHPLYERWGRSEQCFAVVGAAMVTAESEAQTTLPNGVTAVPLGLERLTRWRQRFSRYALMPELQGHLAASWALRELAQTLEPDIIEVCDFGLLCAAFVCAPIAPYTLQLHGSTGQIAQHDPMQGQELVGTLIRTLESALMRYACSSQTYSGSNQRAWAHIAHATVSKLLPALDADAIDRHVASASERRIDPVFRVFGRLQRWKGVETLAAALRSPSLEGATVEWRGRDTRFGSADVLTSSYLQRTFPEIFQKTLVWKEQVPPAQVYALQATALCNIVPSDWDVFNFTVAEAMCSGRPVICSRGAGAAELIQPGVNGLLFDAGDAQGLAAAMRIVREMPERERQAIATRARETVRERLDPDRSAEGRLQAYRAIIQAWQADRPAPPEWLREAVSPDEAPVERPLGALDSVPLRALTSYVTRRLRHKFLTRK